MLLDGELQLKTIAQTYNSESLPIDADLISVVTNHEIIDYLTFNVISDYQIELFLTSLRKSLLNIIIKQKFEQFDIHTLRLLLSALSKQCFNTEYIFFVSDQEKFYLQAYEKHIDEYAEPKQWLLFLIISCYKNIKKEKQIVTLIYEKNTQPIEIRNLIKYQITDAEKENDLKQTIKKIGDISSGVTENVKQHYENNPYPRWFNTRDIIQQSINDFVSQSLSENIHHYRQKKSLDIILVVGCGTGLLSIEHAKRFPNCKIISIDLSLSSLAYAQRQAMDLEINNIEFIQMDLMNVHQLNRQFDFIDCIGVLSHVAEPQKVLELLINQLSSQGTLRFSLYNRLARANMRKAVDYIEQKQYSDTEEAIRKLRHELIKIDGFETLIALEDYHYMSGVRDMFFHSYENHYDLMDIQTMMKGLNCTFLGLELADQTLYEQFSKRYPTQSLFADLNRWHEFEQSYPSGINKDYIVWLQKES